MLPPGTVPTSGKLQTHMHFMQDEMSSNSCQLNAAQGWHDMHDQLHTQAFKNTPDSRNTVALSPHISCVSLPVGRSRLMHSYHKPPTE